MKTHFSPSRAAAGTLLAAVLLSSPALAQGAGQQQGNQQFGGAASGATTFGQSQQQFGQGRQNQTQQGAPSQFRQERGRIVDVRQARVRGLNTPNYLVVIETQPGRRIVADIGQNTRGMNLQQNSNIAVRGEPVRVGNRGALLLADAVRVGDRTFDVDRPAYGRSQQR